MNFNNLKIGTRLYVGFGIMAFLILFLGIRVYYTLNDLDKAKTDLVKSYELADNMSESKYAIRSGMQAIMELIASDNVQDLGEWWAFHQQHVKGYDENIGFLVENSKDGTWGEEFSSLKREVNTKALDLDNTHNNIFQPLVQNIYNAKKKIIELGSSDGSSDELEKMKGELSEFDAKADEAGESIVTAMEDAEKNVLTIVAQSIENSEALESAAKLTVNMAVGISLLLAFVLGLVITRGIAHPMQQSVDFAKKIASGDLLARLAVDQKDEIGDLAKALNDMKDKLNEVITSILSGSDNISAATGQMSDTSQQLSHGANEQASALEEISASIEEITANIQQNTSNAQETDKIATKAAEDMAQGSLAVNQTVASIKTIADKVSIINEIAFQTNILALNAAVEAARAGEHGKGFAVVAGEVRKLAERSQKASKEIDEITKSSVGIAEQTGKLFEEIVPSIHNTAKLVQEIAAASIEQNKGTSQINMAIQQLNQVTQQNAAVSEEMASSSEEMNAQAEQLVDVVGYFKVENSTQAKVGMKSFKTKVAHVSNKQNIKNKGIALKMSTTGDDGFERY